MRTIKQILLYTSFMLTPLMCVGEEIVLEIFLKEKGAHPLYFITEGEKFTPAKPLQSADGKQIDRSSPAAVLQEYLRAAFEGNSARHKELFVPGETPESYLAPDSAGKQLKIALKANLRYGDFNIALSEVENSMWPELMKKVEGKFYLSGALANKDPGWELLSSSFYGPPHPEISTKKEADLKGMISKQLHPLGKATTSPSLKICYTGTEHNPPMELKNSVKHSEQNLETPPGALAAVYSATVANDSEWYLSLVSPKELDAEPYTPGNTIRRRVTNSLKNISNLLKHKKVAVEQEIRLGDYAIFIFAKDGKPSDAKDKNYLAFKRHDGKWLLTDELNGEPILNFLRNDEINSSTAYPGILLSP